MADRLLQERGGKPTGKNWVDNFVKHSPKLRTRPSRPYDRHRALCEDPRVVSPWFTRVQSFKEQYGIVDEDTYNFDETGFVMGVISSHIVVTNSEGPRKRRWVQPGNREWVTVIQGVGASGQIISSFVIFAGKVLISSWYDDLPRDWVLEVSPNGWTLNELCLAWLQHFNKHTKAHTVGTYRLLIVDGHESHCSLGFHQSCLEENIIALCMPAHVSHLLQPLDVGCFAPLKRAYGDEISALARNRTNHISKEAFLPAFEKAFNKAVTKENICASFRGARLVPYNPEAVLSKLEVKLRTPTPATPKDTPWEAKTPSNVRELEAQSTLIRDRVRHHKDSSPAAIIEEIDQLKKGAAVIMHSAVIMRDRLKQLEKANETATQRKSRKRKYIRTEETLTVVESQKEGAWGEALRPLRRNWTQYSYL
ncbi:hypothetical protein PTT_06708 [Pyrenophora teres f. teres 0-1]|uniref:DDE-1 domain-containing protein n=1 Tax=Pyrenophora teres f. teres (strain 0-1) TaxID=861557 RepID=E3RG16_PYRTT|nr:hypothetical protein PTT_06708 [Pyrenophora teres f. teres 0-1]